MLISYICITNILTMEDIDIYQKLIILYLEYYYLTFIIFLHKIKIGYYLLCIIALIILPFHNKIKLNFWFTWILYCILWSYMGYYSILYFILMPTLISRGSGKDRKVLLLRPLYKALFNKKVWVHLNI